MQQLHPRTIATQQQTGATPMENWKIQTVKGKPPTPPAVDVKQRWTKKQRKSTEEQEQEQLQQAIEVNRIPSWRIFILHYAKLHLM